MYRVITAFFFILLINSSVRAQRVYTLQQCIDSSLSNYIPVQRSELATQTAHVNLQQSRAYMLPTLNASLSQGMSFGRSIDPFTNAYANQQFSNANYQLTSGVVLFNGFSVQNGIRQSSFAYDASRMDFQQAKDNLTLNVLLAYLTVLNDEDQLELALGQVDVSNKALDRLQIMNRQGAVKPSDVSDLTGQLMDNELSVVNARNALQSAKLTLAQYMNVPYDSTFQVEKLNVQDLMGEYTSSPVEVYQKALTGFAQVKAVELRTKSAYYNWKAMKGQLFPTLGVGVGAFTNYSSIAQNANGKISYNDQIVNNLNYSPYVYLSIPILNWFQVRNRTKLAKITLKDNELAEQDTKRVLRQNIEQAYLNMRNAWNRYSVLQQQVNAYQESFKAAEVRFNAGVGTSIDYLTIKNRLDVANINLINARYEFVLRKKILDYYQNVKQ